MHRCCSRSITTFVVMGIISCAAACEYSDTPPKAIIGKPMSLTCDPDCDITDEYTWCHIHFNGTKNEVGTGSTLVVSNNVTSASEVGGQLYQCNCSNGAICTLFKIAVKPVAHLHISNNVTKSGSAVNITCTAESYLPANKSNYTYQMKHPMNHPISIEALPGKIGVIHRITAANKENDTGDYECTVTVKMDEYPDISLQSDNVVAHLIVYDAPSISNVRNSTIHWDSGIQDSAILECIVKNREKGLQVWVNWTEYDGKAIEKEHVELQESDVFFLLLYNASANDYMCQIFSSYSPGKPEDQRVVVVMYSGPNTEGLMPQNDDCKSVITGLSITIALLIILGTTLVLAFLLCQRRTKLLQRSSPPENVADTTAPPAPLPDTTAPPAPLPDTTAPPAPLPDTTVPPAPLTNTTALSALPAPPAPLPDTTAVSSQNPTYTKPSPTRVKFCTDDTQATNGSYSNNVQDQTRKTDEFGADKASSSTSPSRKRNSKHRRSSLRPKSTSDLEETQFLVPSDAKIKGGTLPRKASEQGSSGK